MSGGKHTPGPWSLNTQYADIEIRGPEGSGVLVAVMSPWGIGAEEPDPQAANARRIVQCVNAHDELVSVVLDLMLLCDGWKADRGGPVRAREILAKVGAYRPAKAGAAL